MSTPIATLSMYDWPETSSALDRLWSIIAIELKMRDFDTPDALHHQASQLPLWTSPDLIMGQTCGWPYANQLREKVFPFARFDYGLEDCPAGTYRSVYIGQSAEDAAYLKSAETLEQCPAVAINGDDSQSGFHVFSEISEQPSSVSIPFENRVLTGAHRQSIHVVADGKARIAAIDGVAFELAKRHEKEAVSRVEILGFSNPKPGLPLITSHQYADRTDGLFEAVECAISGLTHSDRDLLMINSVLPANDADYEVFLSSQNA